MSDSCRAGWRLFSRGGTVEVQDAKGKPVAHWTGFDAADGTHKQKLANAKLMVAAPDMADFLAGLIREDIADGNCGPKSGAKEEGLTTWCDRCTVARRLLRKAGRRP